MPFQPPYPQLRELIGMTTPRETMIQAACQLIDEEVEKQRGVLGVTMRAVAKMARSLAPRQVEQLVDHFYDPFCDAITPYYHEALELDRPVSEHFAARAPAVAGALLEVTDAYSVQDKDGPLKRAYQSLRHRVVDRIEGSVGALGVLVERHLPAQWAPGRSVRTPPNESRA